MTSKETEIMNAMLKNMKDRVETGLSIKTEMEEYKKFKDMFTTKWEKE